MSRLAPCDFYLLRIPLLSYDKPLQLHHRSNNDYVLFLRAIRQLYADPLLQEAIFLASPALFDEMMKWLAAGIDTAVSTTPQHHKLVKTLYQYLLRMSSRCTPYGLFAGCTVGTLHPQTTELRLATVQSWEKVSRLDMNYLSELATELIKLPEIREQVLFYPNNSLYETGASYRYFEYQLHDKKRYYYLSAFTRTSYLTHIMEAAATGIRIGELTTLLTGMDIPPDVATTFIDELINNQILIASTDPRISGADYFTSLITFLEEQVPQTAVLAPLQEIHHLLLQQEDGIRRNLHIRDIITAHFPAINGKDLIQVDLFYRPAAAAIARPVINSIVQRIEQLCILGKGFVNTDLLTFKEKFLQRYDQREIPLMQALDSESGIGYGIITGDNASYTPLIDDLVLPALKKDTETVWDAVKKLILRKYLAARESQAREVFITEEDLQQLAAEKEARPLPPGLYTMGALIARDAAALDNGDFRFVLKSCGGPNALALMGRFAAGNEVLTTQMRQYAAAEQALEKDRIFAEVIHLPEGRMGNILLRPQLYDYEIPFLGNAAMPAAAQLPVSDLLVSVRNNKVILRSAKLGKEVIPRLTSAHNFTQGLPAYKFLCDLQYQQQTISIQWDWDFLEEQSFLPRVSYQEIILERARWYITKAAFDELLALQHTPDAALLLLQAQFGIPEQVLLSEGDNELPVDFTCTFARSLLTDKLAKSNVILYEQLFNADTRLLSDGTAAYCNEIIIPVRNTTYQPDPGTQAAPPVPANQRIFAPGSAWLYAKIYCGSKWVDKLLVKELLPLIRSWQHEGWITSWFFIRYQDPDTHIRIRFHHTAGGNFSGILMASLSAAIAPYLENDLVQKLQFDTYIREVERYGSYTMLLSEALFYHDSHAVIQLLALHNGRSNEERWQYALLGAAELLRDFGCTLVEKLQLCTDLQQGFFKEHKGDHTLMLQLNNKYRQHTKTMATLLATDAGEGILPPDVTAVFQERSAAQRAVSQQLQELIQQQLVTPADKVRLLGDYLHMFLNRLFIANARLHELVIYHYLMKYYTSQMAMQGNK
ncbi:lantibiotic dehydratase [Chitinophaga nivalis]|uniref:Lantibiotic dehydratase n=1 Tax=Chitinophaga nivalis TaxID=2991709 RepID=A0ABT3IU22_9BACT|nr:lantibiotic dehydratase [Chitinophaga nivalis]MCW3462844.1 lantibiotic dehydratase [Chitinophaga nivalis]MCW3487466.1 lantibiotic dehydratase [Chitinophaga nivalis]